MPTVKPRVQVTLTKVSFRALSTLAKRHSRSMSSLAAEMLNDMLPLMEQALDAAAQLRKLSPQEQLAKVNQMDLWTADAQSRLDALSRGEIPLPDASNVNSAPKTPEEGRDKRPRPEPARAAGRSSRPPRTNRGV